MKKLLIGLLVFGSLCAFAENFVFEMKGECLESSEHKKCNKISLICSNKTDCLEDNELFEKARFSLTENDEVKIKLYQIEKEFIIGTKGRMVQEIPLAGGGIQSQRFELDLLPNVKMKTKASKGLPKYSIGIGGLQRFSTKNQKTYLCVDGQGLIIISDGLGSPGEKWRSLKQTTTQATGVLETQKACKKVETIEDYTEVDQFPGAIG